MYETKKKLFRRFGAFVLALCMTLSLIPAFGGTAKAASSESAMDQLMNWGVVGGYPDGKPHPERQLTRAEFVAMVNRAYGYKIPGETPFIDVPATAWYSDDIGIAYNAGYFGGVSPRMAAPDGTLTREQAMVLLSRNMRLDPVPGEVTEFVDGRDFSPWSRGAARAAAQIGMISGYGDGSFKPTNNITRGEMASMLQRALGTLINKPGVHTLSDTYGNVTISSPNTTLKDSTIAGDLYITGGLDLGDITLDNVRVLGNIIVAGGGESQSGESIILRNVEADSLLVDSIADQYVSLRAEGNTAISETLLRSDAYVQDRTRPGDGLLNITLESPDPDAEFTLSGNLETVINKTPGSALKIAMGTVSDLTIDEKARNSTLNLDINSMASTLNLDTATTITGVGDIDKLFVNAAGSDVEMLPDTITIRPGLTADIAGETMDALQAKESSSDPRLLAGYPKVKNIAPTSATGVYSANKSGTVYWAVSETIDGSIGEDELIEPTEGNTRIFLSGNTPVAKSNEEVTSALANLTPDSNYYLSTIMADARGRHSPVKVASFTTPDNTVPAFTTGYPSITQNDFEYAKNADGSLKIDEKTGDPVIIFRAQVAAMSNKSCQIYYALYPAGSSQPTPQQFRTGSLGRPVSSGVEDITKNTVWLQTFKNLDELTSYDLYLWLTDADGARSSAVQKLTFRTVDGTPPRFQYETPLVSGNPPATSIPTRVNVNEAATVYWVIVKHGEDYIKGFTPSADAKTLEDTLAELKAATFKNDDLAKSLDIFKRKIESGSGSIRNGSTRVTADRDANINITGLTAETAYDIYYIAKDNAGNYSDVKVLENIHTLDTSSPTVTQTFTHPNEDPDKPLEPYADTDILLVFSEDVQDYPARLDENGTPTTLTSVAKDPVALADFLERIVSFYNDSGLDPIRPVSMPDKETGYDENNVPVNDKWTVNFRKATVKQDPDTGSVTVTLTSKTENGKAVGALNLKSGSTYHFEFKDLQDLATTPNRIKPIPYKLDPFRTISAQVLLVENVRAETLDGANPDGDNEIDMAFTMQPVSINVEKSMRWDLLFWSDSTVDYDLYWRERVSEDEEMSGNAYEWNIIPLSGSANSFTDVGTGADGYVGKSLFYHFNYKPREGTDDPNEFVVSLNPDKVYEYAIHFKRVGDEEERGKWNKTIYFHINVVTSMIPQALSRLSGAPSISESTYAESKANGSVLEINNKNDIPGHTGYFTLYQRFSDSQPPEFTHYYPMFAVQDTAVEISVMTDRPGKVYYLVAPFSALDSGGNIIYKADYPPTISGAAPGDGINTTKNANGNLVAFYKGDPIPTSGNANGSNETLQPVQTQGLAVSNPTSSMVYSPSISSNRVKAGYIDSQSGGRAFTTVTGLDPSTSYFVYFVLESNGQRTQEPTVFQFITDTAFRPRLTVLSESSIAEILHEDRDKGIAAVVNYALFDMTVLNQTILWNKLSDHLNSQQREAFEAECSREGSTLSRNIRIYEAIQQLAQDRESIFDKYASTEIKRAVANLAAGTPSKERYHASSVEVKEADTASINTAAGQKPIITGNNYYMLITGRYTSTSTNASGDSFAFRGASPIYSTDDTPPKLVSISGTVNKKEYDSNGTPLRTPEVTGQITFLFDKELYYFNKSNPLVRYPIHLYSSSTDEVDPSTGATFRSVSELFSSINGLAAATSSSNKFKKTNSIRLDFSGNDLFPMVQFVNYIASETSSSREDGLSLRLNLQDLSSGPLTTSEYTFIGPSDIWKTTPQINITANVPSPAATGITVSPGSTTLNIGETVTLTASTVPPSASGTIYWTASGTGNVDLSNSTGKSTTVTARGSGTVTLTAKLGTGASAPTAECKITIRGVSLDITNGNQVVTNQTIEITSGTQLGFSITPSTIPILSMEWSSSNTYSIQVSSPPAATPGVVTGAKGSTGAITLTMRVSSGTSSETYTATVTVKIK